LLDENERLHQIHYVDLAKASPAEQ
jgi:hypothetical protein